MAIQLQATRQNLNLLTISRAGSHLQRSVDLSRSHHVLSVQHRSPVLFRPLPDHNTSSESRVGHHLARRCESETLIDRGRAQRTRSARYQRDAGYQLDGTIVFDETNLNCSIAFRHNSAWSKMLTWSRWQEQINWVDGSAIRHHLNLAPVKNSISRWNHPRIGHLDDSALTQRANGPVDRTNRLGSDGLLRLCGERPRLMADSTRRQNGPVFGCYLQHF